MRVRTLRIPGGEAVETVFPPQNFKRSRLSKYSAGWALDLLQSQPPPVSPHRTILIRVPPLQPDVAFTFLPRPTIVAQISSEVRGLTEY